MAERQQIFSSFIFYRLHDGFRRLSPNEQMTAKQDFENIISAHQERVFLRTYMTAGLSSESDLMIWRMSIRISRLQELSASALKTGLGTWLLPVEEYLGILSFETSGPIGNAEQEANFIFGRFPYMMLAPVKKNDDWYLLKENEKAGLLLERNKILKKYKNVTENIFSSYGLDRQDFIIQREAEAASDLEAVTSELRLLKNKEHTVSDSHSLFCIGRDLTEILDYLA